MALTESKQTSPVQTETASAATATTASTSTPAVPTSTLTQTPAEPTSTSSPGHAAQAFQIEAKSLDLFYGDFQALHGINLNIRQKQITALIGPSGCGKSTFLRTLNRMNDLVAGVSIKGEVRIGGVNIYEKNVNVVELRKKVGMVFQKPNPFPMSIWDNIAYGPKAHGIKKKAQLSEIIERSLRQAALWEEVKDRLHASAMGLSGGQQQRLCIARVLAVEPEIVLMDEPTSALDPLATLKVEELVNELKKAYTIVIVTHNMQQAARISDVTSFFLNGKIVETDDTAKIFTNPTHKQTEDYITGKFG